MKKFLLTSSALVASAGVAAADVSISGSAEMGMFGGTENDAQFHNDWDVTFAMSGTTDNGLEFGASVDLDEADSLGDEDGNPGGTVFISGGWGTLTMGDTDGAADWAISEAGGIGNPGTLADDETGHAGALNNVLDGEYDGQILRYDYTAGSFGVAVSAEIDDDDNLDPGFAVGAKYSMDIAAGSVDFGIGYQSVDSWSDVAGTDGAAGEDLTAIAGSVAMALDSGLSAGLHYTQLDADGVDATHIGVGAGYEVGAIALHANYGQFDVDGSDDITGYGLAAAYDLGGGATINLGYGASDEGTDTTDTWSFGLKMSF